MKARSRPVETKAGTLDLYLTAVPPSWAVKLILLVAGGLSALGMAPLFWWPLTLIGLVLLLLYLESIRTGRSAFLYGWLFGVGHFAVGLNWIAKSFTYQAAMPAWLGWIAVVLLSLFMACYIGFASLLAWRIGHKKPVTLVVALAGSWTLFEWLRATLLTGFAWNPLSEVALPMGIAGAAASFGTYGLSAIVVLVAGALWLLLSRRWIAGLVLLAYPALVLVADWVTLPSSDAPPSGPKVTLVQPNVGQEDKWEGNATDANFAKLAQQTLPKNSAPRLILWTEASIPDYLETGYPADYYRQSPDETRRKITALMNPDDIILLGALKIDFNTAGAPVGARNSIFMMDAHAQLHNRYDKSHLLPFGEYLPLRSLLTPLGLSRLAPGDLDFQPGAGPATIDTGRFGKVGLIICYELIFSGQVVDKANRPAFVFSPSNDAWFGAWGPPQHHAQARLRAIEEGLPFVRVTPTGISSIIDADGKVVATIPQGEAGRIDAAIPPAKAPTFFARYGNAISVALGLILILVGLALARRPRSG